MRGKIAWLKSPVRHRTLAPFDGITRIRFKGSSNWTSQPLRLPRIVELRIKPDLTKSTRLQIANHRLLNVPAKLESLGCRSVGTVSTRAGTQSSRDNGSRFKRCCWRGSCRLRLREKGGSTDQLK